MADTKKYGWNVQIDGVQYLVEYMKGSIFINGGEAFKLRSLERTGTLRKDKQLSYTVPLAGKELNLVISAVSGISLIMDGMDLGTYPDGAGANQKAPAWIVVFYVLYFIEYWVHNFLSSRRQMPNCMSHRQMSYKFLSYMYTLHPHF